MLICEWIASPDDKEEILKKSLNDNSLWVVSDLQSKFWLQKRMREKGQKVLSSERVLRASELWQAFFFKQAPDWQILSPALSLFVIEKWLREAPHISAKDRQKAYDTVAQLLPLLTHFEGASALQEWFSEREEAKERWGHWYELSHFLWEKFKQQKMIPGDWVSGLLLHEELILDKKNPLVFDLGIQLGDIESELILNLSRDIDVTVIIPHEDAGEHISAYEPLLARGQQKKYKQRPLKTKKSFKKLPTMLSEVKEAVGQIRFWVNNGVELDQMAILSPAIENYWATLSEYLIVEGIPFKKATVAPLSQFDFYNQWISALRLSLQEAEAIDGKQYFFLNKEEPLVDYEKYQQLFSYIYSQEDFHREKVLKEHLPTMTSLSELSFADFLQWAVPFWTTKDQQPLDFLLSQFDEDLLLKEKLSPLKWVEYIEYFLSRKEKRLEEECEHGIYVLSPQAAENIPLKKVIFLGLSEKNLNQSNQTSLQLGDIESLKIQMGFSLPHAERQGKLFQLQWITEKSIEEMVFLHSETDFSGSFQAPSIFWLQQALESEQDIDLQSPVKTRWDELMLNGESGPLVESPYKEGLQEVLQNLFEKEEQGVVDLIPQTDISLSASMLEEYFQCPFKFYSQKVLGLSKLPSLDLDIDYMTRGRLLHKICELIVLGKNFSLSEKDLLEIIEKGKKQIQMSLGDENLWPAMRGFYLKLAQSFMQFEREWRAEYPKVKTGKVEHYLKGYIQAEGRPLFSQNKDEGSFPFRGFVDRLDEDGEGHFLVIDYKSSGSGLSQYKSWLQKGELQLALYSMALEQGLGDCVGEVVGASYFVVKEQQRNKGFNANQDPQFSSMGKMKEEEKNELYEAITDQTQEIVRQIARGDFSPKPQDEKVCTDCQWKALCRYPKLNQ